MSEETEECPLSNRQLQIMELLAEGLMYTEIAQRLDLSVSTVRSHLHRAFVVLDVDDRAQAVIRCASSGWLVGVDTGRPEDGVGHLLRQVRLTVRQLCDAIRERNRLTPRQKEYLSAFDAMLYARSDAEKVVARRGMDNALGVMLQEAGVTARPRPKRDLVDLLVGYVQQARVAA